MEWTTEMLQDNRDRSYALLTLDQRTLLMPQSEIRTLESVLDIHTGHPPVQAVGWLSFEQQDCPVYGMDAALAPLSEVPVSQRICVLLTLSQGYFGLLCSDIATLPGSAVEFRPLPAAMATPNTPLRALALFEGRVALVSTAMALAAYLSVNVEALTTP